MTTHRPISDYNVGQHCQQWHLCPTPSEAPLRRGKGRVRPRPLRGAAVSSASTSRSRNTCASWPATVAHGSGAGGSGSGTVSPVSPRRRRLGAPPDTDWSVRARLAPTGRTGEPPASTGGGRGGARGWRRSRRSPAAPPHAGGAAACGGAPQRATPRRPARRHAPRPARDAHHETYRAETSCCRRGVDGPARANDRAAPRAPAQPSEPRAHARGRLGAATTPSAAIVVASTGPCLYPLTTGGAPSNI